MIAKTSLAAALACAALPASAQVGIHFGGGTTGLGLGAAYTLGPSIDLRADYTAVRYDLKRTGDDIDYKGRLNLSNIGLKLDYFLGARFHLTAGIYQARSRGTLVGRPSAASTFTLNGTDYAAGPGSSLEADTRLQDGIAPYLGIGWATRPSAGPGFGFRFELGAMFTDPSVRLSATGLSGPNLQRDLAAEENDLNDTLRKYRVFPVVAGFVSYQF